VEVLKEQLKILPESESASTSYLNSTDFYRVQKTLRAAIEFQGIGLHTGEQGRIKLLPAPANHGIAFYRKDIEDTVRVKAHYSQIVDTKMATTLGDRKRPEANVRTVEHLLSALYGLGITNLAIEIWGPEVPILDGSSLQFLEKALSTGIQFQAYTNPVVRVLKPIRVYHLGGVCELLPRKNFRLTTSVDFEHPDIGVQTYALELTPNSFMQEIARARTFGFKQDLDKLKKIGLARGASIENVLAFDEKKILNPEGARFQDECVRHKLLDAIGDLALFGAWIEGELVSFRGGHSIHAELLKAISNNPGLWELKPAVALHTPLSNQVVSSLVN